MAEEQLLERPCGSWNLKYLLFVTTFIEEVCQPLIQIKDKIFILDLEL